MTSWHGNVTDPVCDGIHLAPVMRNFEVVVEPNKLSKKTFELQTIWDAMTLTWRSYYYKQNGRHFAADNLKCIFTLGQFWPSGIVIACVCLCPRVRPCVSVSMCVCVCLCVCCVSHLLVRAITRNPFKLGSPNLDWRCKRPWLGSLLFW